MDFNPGQENQDAPDAIPADVSGIDGQAPAVNDATIQQPDALANAFTNMGTLSPAADTPEGFDMPVVMRGEPKPVRPPHGIAEASQEMARRRQAKEEYRLAAEKALREANDRLDLLRYRKVNEEMREFGIPADEVRGFSSTLDDDLNEQKYNATGVRQRLLNAANSGLLKWGQGRKVDLLGMFSRMGRDDDQIEVDGDSGKFLTPALASIYDDLPARRQHRSEQTERTIELVVQAQKELDQIPENPHVRRMAAAQTELEAFKIFLKDPWMILGEGFAESAPTAAVGIGATALMGPALGGVFTGVIEFDSAFHSKIVENLKEKQIDLGNPKALRAAIENQKMMREVFSDAWWHAVATTATDKLAGPIKSQVKVPIQQPGLRQAVNTPLKAGIDGAIAVGGEALSAEITGEKVSPDDNVKTFIQNTAGSAMGNVGDNLKAKLKSLPPAIRTARLEAQEQHRFSSNRYIEPQTLQADTAVTLAERAVAAAGKIRSWKDLKSKRDPDQYITEQLGEDLKGYIAPSDLKALIDKGYFIEDGVADLKLREKIVAAEASGGNVEIPMRDLIKGNNIKANNRGDVINSLRFEEDGPTGHDAKRHIETDSARLKHIEKRYDVSHPGKVEGGYTFHKIVGDLKWNDRLSGSEAWRQAARRIEVYEERARAMSVEGRRETADTIYLRDEFRKRRHLSFNPRPNEDRKAEDEYVANQLRRLGIAEP